MTLPQWPSVLPLPERDTYRRTPQDPRQKRQSEIGPPGYRRKSSSVAEQVTLSVTLTADHRAVFDNFYRIDAKRGTVLFEMPDPTTDGWGLATSDGAPLLTGSGAPLVMSAMWLCQFGDQVPEETISGIEFIKTFSIWVMP